VNVKKNSNFTAAAVLFGPIIFHFSLKLRTYLFEHIPALVLLTNKSRSQGAPLFRRK
jgi:hypothetical protein